MSMTLAAVCVCIDSVLLLPSEVKRIQRQDYVSYPPCHLYLHDRSNRKTEIMCDRFHETSLNAKPIGKASRSHQSEIETFPR